MKSKIFNYEGRDHTVSYDVARCIHAAECVKGLPAVFDPNRKPWVDADAADTSELKVVIDKCPTGALKLQTMHGTIYETAEVDTAILVDTDGPLYVNGPAVIVASDGEEIVLEDTRIALCRCGASDNKPLCDGSHTKAGFADSGAFHEVKVKNEDGQKPGPLRVVLAQNGPLLLRGYFTLKGADDTVEGSQCALCRCGGSGNKPFCDGAHKSNGFSDA